MRKGICVAGHMAVDITYKIEGWPSEGELVRITSQAERSTGGAVCNTIIDLAKLDANMPLYAAGLTGRDNEGTYMLEELGKYPNIDLNMVQRSGDTSITVVMSNNLSKERTFFQYPGGNAAYCEEHIDVDALDVDIFHIGYILLLDALDEKDAEYGTRMARLLKHVQDKGIKTSIDVVTEAGSRFQELVVPALRYSDYCIINEIEASKTTGIALRDENGELIRDNIRPTLEKMKELGVSTWAVIHCPEAGFGLDEKGKYFEQPSLKLPSGFIKGTVGAGDAFCAGVLCAAENGQGMQQALKLGVCSAAASLSCANASDGVDSMENVMKLYELYKK